MQRLKRHEVASEQLNNEIDIVKLLYVQRIGQFIAKLILKKHQRALVTSLRNTKLMILVNQLKQAMTPVSS